MITEATVIRGEYRTHRVFLDDQRLSERASDSVTRHSRDFMWGYCGGGPAQLALALMYEIMPAAAADLYMQFQADIIANLPRDDFTIKGETIIKWLMDQPLAKTCGGKDASKDDAFGCGFISSPDHMG